MQATQIAATLAVGVAVGVAVSRLLPMPTAASASSVEQQLRAKVALIPAAHVPSAQHPLTSPLAAPSRRAQVVALEQANIALRRRSSDSPPPAGHLWGGDPSALNRETYLDGMAWPHRS